MANQLAKYGPYLSRQAKEEVWNIKTRYLTETYFIKADPNRTGRIENEYNTTLDPLRWEVDGLNKGMLNNSSLQQWSEDRFIDGQGEYFRKEVG